MYVSIGRHSLFVLIEYVNLYVFVTGGCFVYFGGKRGRLGKKGEVEVRSGMER